MSKQNKALLDRISIFLGEPHKNDGDRRTPVSKDDFQELMIIIERLIDAKWERDCDGDPSVEYILVDRTRYQCFP